MDPEARTVYSYGQEPDSHGLWDLSHWTEYMTYQYLPVVMPDQPGVRLPENLQFVSPILERIMEYECIDGLDHPGLYVYVSAKRGWATPGNPLNRPGWHADGFGSDDVNWIWSDRWPTRFAYGHFQDISDNHVQSARQFEAQIEDSARTGNIWLSAGLPGELLRLDPSVVHATPTIDPPGGERSFLKVSVSPHKYNLLGNAHNHLFDYEWKMWPRDIARNDPAYTGGDFAPEEEGR